MGFDKEKFGKSWFTTALEHVGLSQNQLAKNIGMDQSALSLTVNGRRKMSATEAVAIARELNVPIETLLIYFGGLVPPLPKTRLAIGNYINESGELLSGETPEHPGVELPANAPLSCDATLIRTPDGLFDRWVLFYHRHHDVPASAIDRICIVEITGEDKPLLCKVTRGFEMDHFTIHPFFGGDAFQAHLISASPILWMQQ
ncbi:helix-turn-helix transcriptional regulator [Oxalobacter sp. OttesenSCG-928-P03]|nr:helix-turn-helix transcriptional regulator [Oxalobacter sp. OttesenSCG-928-P03]